MAQEWQEYDGSEIPEGFHALEEGSMAQDNRGQWWARQVGSGKAMVLVGDGATDGHGAPVGHGAAQVGDAVQISAVVADTAVTDTGGNAHDGFYTATPPADVQSVLDPNNAGAQLGMTPVYAQYKSPPNAEVWQFSQQGFTQGHGVDQSKLSTIPGTPGSGILGTLSNMSTGAKVALGALVLGAGGVAVWAIAKKSKRK